MNKNKNKKMQKRKLTLKSMQQKTERLGSLLGLFCNQSDDLLFQGEIIHLASIDPLGSEFNNLARVLDKRKPLFKNYTYDSIYNENDFKDELDFKEMLKNGDVESLREFLNSRSGIVSFFSDNTNCINDVEMRLLVEAQKENTSITGYLFRNNRICKNIVEILANSLKNNPHIRSIDLEENYIREGIESLVEAVIEHPSIEILNISRNQIKLHHVKNTNTPKFITKLIRESQLKKLNISLNSFIASDYDSILSALCSNKTLTNISLSGDYFNEKVAKLLGNTLLYNKTLLKIDLASSPLNNAGAISLAESLASSSLVEINLSNCNIGDDGAIALAATFPYNNINRIILNKNRIKRDGAIALAHGFRNSKAGMVSIDLKGNLIGNEGAIAFSEMLKHNNTVTSVYIGSVYIGYNTGYNTIDGNGAFDEMLKHNNNITRLKHNNTVTSVYIGGNNIDDNGAFAFAEMLKHNNNITAIDFWLNQIGNNGMIALAEMLKQNTKIVKLGLCENLIGKDGLDALVSAMKVNKTLTDLNLGGNKIKDDGCASLAMIISFNQLKHLDISTNTIGNNGMKEIVRALVLNQSLHYFNACYNYFGDEGIAEMVPGVSQLKSTYLYCRHISQEAFTALKNRFPTGVIN